MDATRVEVAAAPDFGASVSLTCRRGVRGAVSLADERERARSLATRLVAFSIGIVGVVLVVFAFFLTFYGGAGMLFLSAILFVVGAVIAALGFFFQLVPLRLDELAQKKRELEVQTREKP